MQTAASLSDLALLMDSVHSLLTPSEDSDPGRTTVSSRTLSSPNSSLVTTLLAALLAVQHNR